MTNNRHPDRLQPHDLDELDNVPTYDPKAGGSGLGKFYERFGRSAPQSIEPVAPAPKTEPDVPNAEPAAPKAEQTSKAEPEVPQVPATDAFAAPTTNELYKVSSEPEPTAVFEAPAAQTASQPATAFAAPFEEPEAAVTPVLAVAEADAPVVEKPADVRRGTMDLGLMIIRVVVGALLTFMTLRTFFELGGAAGINNLKTQYSGYAMGGLLAILVPTMQLIAGVFLLLGLLTPVAASVATAITGFGAVDALAQQDGVNLMNPGDSLILPFLLAAIAFGLQFTGPGRISLDVARSWAKRPLVSSWIWAIIGVAGAVAMWWFLAGVNPLS